MSNSTLSFYWDLAVTDPQLRNNACSKLIQSLTEFQQKFLAETQHTESELSSWESVKANCAPDICYALKRLIRGLSSSRDCAREGFTVALTELFRLMPNLTVGFATELIIDISKNNGTKSGQEEREVSFARLFGFEAIILSGMLNRKSTMSKDIVGLAQNLGTIMKKKEYLKEASTAVFINLLKHLQGQQESANLVIDQFLEDCPQESLELVWFYSEVSSIYPEYQHWKSKLSGWKKGNILHEKNKNTLKKVLIESTYYIDQIHSAFEAVVRRIVSLGHGLLEFWTLIEQSFFNGSHERKRIGFQVFSIVLRAAKLNEIPLIFTPNFMRCLINSLSSKDTVLNKQAKQTTRSLADYAQENQEVALPLVLQLVGEFGHFKFDAITNTNTVENILSKLTSEGIRQYCDHLIKIFYEPESLTNSNDGKRSSDAAQLWVIDQLYLFLRTGKIEKDKGWLEMIMNFVVVQGFFTVKSTSQSLLYLKPIKITDIIRQACKEKIGSSITYLKRVSLSDADGNRLPLGEINGKTWAFHLVEKIEEFMKDSNFEFVAGLDKSILDASSRSKVLANKIHSQLSSTADNAGLFLKLKTFESLFSHMSLFLYTGVEDSGDIVQDIEHCYSLLVPFTESSTKKRKIEEDSLQPVDVLTDILISFLAKPSQVLRNLANEVFAVFAPKASSSVLTIIFDVLNAKAGVEGADVLFDQDQGSGDDSSESTTEDDNDIDNESFDDENTAVDHELREKIEQALKTEHQDDLEDLNDEDMEIFDNKLAEIFGQRKALQKMKKESKENVFHFKLRVLDLLDTFLKVSIAKPIVIDAIGPLLELLKDNSNSDQNKILYSKVSGIITNRFKVLKELPTLPDTDVALELLSKIHEICSKNLDVSTLNQFSIVCVFLAKSILHSDAQKTGVQSKAKKSRKDSVKKIDLLQQVSDIYIATYDRMMDVKNSNLKAKFFSDVITRIPALSWKLLSEILKKCRQSEKPRSYLLVKSLELCSIIFKSAAVDDQSRPEFCRGITNFKVIIEEFIETLPNLPENGPFSMPKDRLKAVLKCVVSVIRKSKTALSQDKFKECWDGTTIGSRLEQFFDQERYSNQKGLKAMSKEINSIL